MTHNERLQNYFDGLRQNMSWSQILHQNLKNFMNRASVILLKDRMRFEEPMSSMIRYFYRRKIFFLSLYIEHYVHSNFRYISLVGWSCRIHRLHLYREVRPPTTTSECPGYDIKQSDGEAPDLEHWGMRSTYLASLSGPPRSGLIEPDRIISSNRTAWSFNCV